MGPYIYIIYSFEKGMKYSVIRSKQKCRLGKLKPETNEKPAYGSRREGGKRGFPGKKLERQRSDRS